MKMAIVEFQTKFHSCDHNMTKVQRVAKDLKTGKDFWLSFTNRSKMYPKICNTRDTKYIELIKYNDDWNDRAQIVKNYTPQILLEYGEYLI